MTAALGSPTYTTYLDLEDQVLPWLQFTGVTIDPQVQNALQLIVDGVCTEIQRFIGHAIAPTTYGPADGLGKFDGNAGLNSGYIMLPKTPVISIEEVIEYQGDNPVTLTEVDPSTGNTGGDGYQINYRTGRMTRVLGGIWNRPFYPGSNNVWVTWTAGYNPIPADMILTTVRWVTEIYRNNQQAARQNLRSGPDIEPPSPAPWQGMPRWVELDLATYARIGVR